MKKREKRSGPPNYQETDSEAPASPTEESSSQTITLSLLSKSKPTVWIGQCSAGTTYIKAMQTETEFEFCWAL